MTISDPVDVECPPDVVDRLMWRTALRILNRHVARLDGRCSWCGGHSPCSAKRLAKRADAVARLPWHEAMAERNDITRLLPVVAAAPPASTATRPRNKRSFDW